MDKELRFKRIRRLKKWMRPLPRRSNIHRYPVLKWFSKFAYDRSYLWSFRSRTIVPALFLGSLDCYATNCRTSDDCCFLFGYGGASKFTFNHSPSVDFESFQHGTDLLCRLSSWNDLFSSAWN